eukprot:1154090-Pelagomonas_calceolata.AAC.11
MFPVCCAPVRLAPPTGLLPWMVFLHCGFGLWMHSYFMMRNWDREATAVFVQTGKGGYLR